MVLIPKPIRSGNQYFHYRDDELALGRLKAKQTPSDSGLYWELYGPLTPDQIAQITQPGRGTGVDYDCSGRYFDRGLSVKRQTPTRTLFVCSWGYDL